MQLSYIIVDSTPGTDKASVAGGSEALEQLRNLLVPAAQILGVTLTLPGTFTRFGTKIIIHTCSLFTSRIALIT